MSPIELPPNPQGIGRQSHDYRTTTKGNPIQGKTEVPPSSIQLRHRRPIVTSQKLSSEEHRVREVGRKPLSNCFYGGAFPQCLA
ncbi:hypothetical protein POX_f08007 [Penicillium oxalicum]|uniref:Uncharacterized protein n=1 Tax=Penicillium oxalicum (strain 114-2 / CGMCC 5302) TaxID=933388 RepID=S8ASA3_PENO1|nr:hypothetical protein POX_f08007 [Penicillium oxalicum]EPS28933.1 hypothetical protein PDE_03879 [Penicillium oxalicum 114-2]KAI2787634.1 hypothetical protein POX_f08007 [Penicillium oxalicum]